MTEMEKVSQNESLILDNSQRAFSKSCSSPITPYRNSDVDFHDVFGGPPRRRSSIHDVGYDSNDSKNSVESKGDDEPLFGLSNDKPVFGDETLNRRRYPSKDFFDDIFRVNESVSSAPRKLERDPFSSSPGSRVLSPARPLQPLKSETSAQLSLPGRVSKGIDLPTFGSAPCSPFKDSASIGISYSPGVALSRFSNHGNEDLGGNEVRSSYCQSPQSQEFSLSREGSSELTKSEKTGLGSNSKRYSETSENSTDDSPFHFSIYKWASKGVPLELPLREVYSSRLKGGVKVEQLSRSDGCKNNENRAAESQSSQFPRCDCPPTGLMSSSFQQDKLKVDLLLDEIIPDKAKPCEIVEEVNFVVPESEMFESFQNLIEDVADNTIMSHISEDMRSHCLSEKAEKKITQARRSGLKPLRSLFFDNDSTEGSKRTARISHQKESVAKNTKILPVAADSRRNVMKQYENRASAASSDMDKSSCPSSPMNSKDSQGRNKVKGKVKVKEFVKMFNQDTSSEIKDTVGLQSRSSTSKGDGVNNDHITTAQMPKLTQLPNASKMGAEDPKKFVKELASMKTASFFFDDFFGNDSAAFTTGSFRKASRSIVVETDDSFLGDFQIKELPQDENELSLSTKNREEIEAIDAKIQKWKKGKEGNIRSLLSTLQYVLWAESGWKAIALVDIIEGNAVKRAYQKALLCLHPDKLQQKGAASHQKYLAEKVFDTLQESWDYFNSNARL